VVSRWLFITQGGNPTQCVQIEAFKETTPDCYFYGSVSNFWGQYGPALISLTSESASHYNAAFAAQPGLNFANGLGSVNAANLLAAWQLFNFGQFGFHR
jgi:hypothetical protein